MAQIPIGSPLDLALRLYDQIDVSNPTLGDLLFNIFGPGNTLNTVERPYERLLGYEVLLRALWEHDPSKYSQLHKGTAFYFVCWLYLDLRNYDSGLFYIDAAMSEDVRRAPSQWLTEPAGAFLTLANPANQVAGRHVANIRRLLEAHVARYNSVFVGTLTVDDVVDRFVKVFVRQPEHRTIVSAWYVHLLEFEDRIGDLTLRSAGGGSIAPFLDHLFRGGLLLESVLKYLYPAGGGGTLGAIYNDPAFRTDFGGPFSTSAHTFADIIRGITGPPEHRAFSTSAKLRNTSGHNLVWDDALDPIAYRTLYEQEVNAMLLVISTKF